MFTVFGAEVGKSSELQNELSRPLTTHSDDLRKDLTELDNIRGSKEHEQVVPSV